MISLIPVIKLLPFSLNTVGISFDLDETERNKVLQSFHSHRGETHKVSRDSVYENVLNLYTLECPGILQESPFRVTFEGERAIDKGGVTEICFQPSGSKHTTVHLMVAQPSSLLLTPKWIRVSFRYWGLYCRIAM